MHRSKGATALLGMEEFLVGAQAEVDGEGLTYGRDDPRGRRLRCVRDARCGPRPASPAGARSAARDRPWCWCGASGSGAAPMATVTWGPGRRKRMRSRRGRCSPSGPGRRSVDGCAPKDTRSPRWLGPSSWLAHGHGRGCRPRPAGWTTFPFVDLDRQRLVDVVPGRSAMAAFTLLLAAAVEAGQGGQASRHRGAHPLVLLHPAAEQLQMPSPYSNSSSLASSHQLPNSRRSMA